MKGTDLGNQGELTLGGERKVLSKVIEKVP